MKIQSILNGYLIKEIMTGILKDTELAFCLNQLHVESRGPTNGPESWKCNK